MTEDIQQLLPFYVNGSLEGDEKALVEAALKENPSLQGEVAFLEKLRDEVKAQDGERSPGEFGLKRLQKSMAEDRLKNDPIARAESKIPKEQNRLWKGVAAAACLMLLLQSAVIFRSDPGDLTAAGGPAMTRTAGHIIDVTFAPTAREENIRALLLGVEAVIVDGPSALGVYRLSVPKDPEAALEKLRAHKNLVESAGLSGRRNAGP